MFISLDMYAVFGIISALLALSSHVIYIRKTLRREITPNRASWWIWGILGTIILASYLSVGATWSAAAILTGAAIGPITIALLSFRYGEGGFSNMDKGLLIGAGIILLIWWLTDSAIIALLSTLTADAMGIPPTALKAYLRPKSESLLSWSLIFSGNLVNLFAVEKWSFQVGILPIYNVLATGLLITLILIGKKQINKLV